MSHGSARFTEPDQNDKGPRPVTVLDALRGATTRQHRELEALPLNARLLAPNVTLAEYRAILTAMYGFYDPLAGRAHAVGASWAKHAAARAGALAADLIELGLDADYLAGVPRCTDLPELGTPDRALGCGYVFEGAALGGRVILRHLARVFESQAGIPFRFLTGDGAATAERWKTFCAELCATAADAEEVCAGAVDAFDAMARWLRRPATAIAHR